MNLYAHASDIPFKNGEELKYEVKYKYGLVMLRAGTANFTTTPYQDNGNSAYRSALDFKTSSFFDRIFRIRDTLVSEANEYLEPLHHRKNINEGNTHFTEELFVHEFNVDYTEVRIRRHNAVSVRFDTILSATNIGFDMINVFVWFRSLDYSKMENGKSFSITAFVGRDKVNMVVHYEGKTVIEESKNIPSKTLKLVVDIIDVAFKESKSAMEIWISDDENKIPLKIKAKLKIGSAEAELLSYKKPNHPFTSQIKIPSR
jgi:hypothetical protein